MFGRSLASSLRALLVAAAAAWLPGAAQAQDGAIKTDLTLTTADGYARIVFNFAEPNEADVRLSNGVLVISFKNPVDVDVTRLIASNEYVSAARRDPDGKGVRLALMQKVRVSSMVAGERFFIDLLPPSWTAAPPPLPKEVVEDLVRRAREAEKRAQLGQALAKQRAQIALRVRVSRQPTFTRYIFELPEFVPVTAERNKDTLTLAFDAVLRFDLTDTKRSPPPVVQSIETKATDTSTSVVMELVGKVDVRAFREDANYVVDIVMADALGRAGNTSPAGIGKKAFDVPSAVEGKSDHGLPPALQGRLDRSKDPLRALAAPPPVKVEGAPPRAASPAVRSALEPPPAPAPQKPAIETAAAPATAAPAAAAPAAAAPPAAAAASPAPPSAAPAAAPIAATPAPAAKRAQDPNGGPAITLERRGDTVRLAVPFDKPTPAAVFVRADTLWLVFDTDASFDVSGLVDEVIRDVSVALQGGARIIRVKLERPRLIGTALEDNAWVVNIGDAVTAPPQPLAVMRNVATPRATAHIPFEQPRRLHRIEDPEVGDALMVVTGTGPPRGIAKAQDFVDFRALATAQGVVVQPVADDLRVELASDRVVIGRPSGLTLTSAAPAGKRAGIVRPMMFDPQQWGFDRQADFLGRSTSLINAAAQAADAKRFSARLELARFYFARDMYPEAKAVLDLALADERPTVEDTTALVMRGVAKILMGRPEDGLKDINDPIVGNQNDAPVWRGLAAAEQRRWADAREAFRKTEVAVGMLPIELQRRVLLEAVSASIELADFAGAADQLNDYETLSIPPEEEPQIAVLTGRIHEGLGRGGDALIAYRAAAESGNRAASAQGRLREIVLRHRDADMKRGEAITDLETLTTIWRGDQTEIEALQLLAKLYTEEGRYRDAFSVMRTAARVHPNSQMTRAIQDDAAATFDKLFLGGMVDGMPAIEALSLFYDFRELVPIGRRGDEMIRRLTDRLVAVDLLDQAAELLQHQIEHRLEGAARAQVAIRLAAIYLMNRKPERAIQVIRATRSNELSSELRTQRLLLEARALSDSGRGNLALEVIEHLDGPEVIRARSDILWASKRFGEAAEQIELLFGERWRDWTPLKDSERRDVLRAALGYNLGEDPLGLGRLKEKFGPAMLQSADRRAFEVVTAPLQSVADDEFRTIARAIAAADTLEQFLRELRARYQEISGLPQPVLPPRPGRQPAADPTPTGAIPPLAAR